MYIILIAVLFVLLFVQKKQNNKTPEEGSTKTSEQETADLGE